MTKKNKTIIGVIIAIFLAVGICAASFFVAKDSEFAGADDKAGDVIMEIDKNYKPWASPIWEPPGAETESLLFALQTAIGSGVLFFFMGYLLGSSKLKKKDS